MTPPCKDCERKGCGAYHERCGKYLMYKLKKKREQQARIEEIRRSDDLLLTRKRRWPSA